MKNLETRSVNINLEPLAEGSRRIEGYAHIFSDQYTKLTDRWGDTFSEKVLPGAFVNSLASNEHDVFMLIDHDWTRVVGRTGANLTVVEDTKGLKFSVEVPNTTDGNDLLENVKLGLIKGCSFGFNILNANERWNSDYTEFYRDITAVDLYEITATALPCYENTEISARSSLSIRDIRQKAPETTEVKSDVETRSKNVNMILSFLTALSSENK